MKSILHRSPLEKLIENNDTTHLKKMKSDRFNIIFSFHTFVNQVICFVRSISLFSNIPQINRNATRITLFLRKNLKLVYLFTISAILVG